MNNLAKKKKTVIYLISGILVIVGIGTIAYLVWPKNQTKTETKSQTEEKVQQLQNQLSQIKQALITLNHNITQTQSSLQQKRTQQAQTPQNSLQTEINQLEQQLTTYQAQKQKLETIIPKLEQQISNLSNPSESNSESEQEQIIQQLEQEIKEINQELGIDDKTDDPQPDNPPKNDLPNKDNPTPNPPSKKPNKTPNSPPDNPQTFQTLQEQAKELQTEIAKINQKYQGERDDYNSQPQDVRDLIDVMFEGKIKKFFDSLQPIEEIDAKTFSADAYQYFLGCNDGQQQELIRTQKGKINAVLYQAKGSLTNIVSQLKEFGKIGAEMMTELEKNFGLTPEVVQGKQEVQKNEAIIADCESKLNNLSQQGISEQIVTIGEICQGLEKLDWNQKKK